MKEILGIALRNRYLVETTFENSITNKEKKENIIGLLCIKVDGKTIGGIAASGAKSEIDEAIAQAGLDAVFKK